MGSGGRGFESRPRHTKGVKMVPMATLLGAQHYKASTGFSSPNKYRTTNIATLTNIKKVRKSPIIINVCFHRRTVWKTGNYAKYVILLKYRDYYNYNYYYYYNIIFIIIIIIIIIIITSVSSKFTDFWLLTDMCQQHIFRIFAIDFHNLSFPQTTNRLT